MSTETTILDFQLSNTFEQYESHMYAEEQQTMFKEMGVKTLYIGKSLDEPQRATVISVSYTHLTLPTILLV